MSGNFMREVLQRLVVTWGDASGSLREVATVVWLGHWEYTVWQCPTIAVLDKYAEWSDNHIGVLE